MEVLSSSLYLGSAKPSLALHCCSVSRSLPLLSSPCQGAKSHLVLNQLLSTHCIHFIYIVLFIIMNTILHFDWTSFKSKAIPYAISHVSFILETHNLVNSFYHYALGSFFICMSFAIFDPNYNRTHLGLNIYTKYLQVSWNTIVP